MRSVLSIILAIAVVVPVARAQKDASCAFDYVVGEGLIAETFIEITFALSTNPEEADLLRRGLPNLKRVFFSPPGKYSALVGWSRLPEDYSKFSELQVRAQFTELLKLNKRAINPEAEVSHHFAETTPFSVYVTLDYLNKGEPYRDVGMDVLATPLCILSVKFSGPMVQEEANVWDQFAEELERIRAVVAAVEEPVVFSEEGARFSFYGVLGTAIYLGVAVGIALLAFFGLRWRFRIEPGKAAWLYSTIIAVMAALSISMTVYANETFRGTPTLPYESIMIYLVVLAVHLTVLIMRTAPLILVT